MSAYSRLYSPSMLHFLSSLLLCPHIVSTQRMLINRRSLRRHIRVRNVFIVLLFWIVVDLLTIRARLSCLDNHNELLSPDTQRVFITSLHWNNELILRSHWNAAVIELVKTLGPQNVFLSIYESGSWDDSKGALRELDYQLGLLGVPRSIILDETTHLDEISKAPAPEGWIETPRGRTELRRIPYLAKLRNLTLRPLQELYERGQTFDRILFLGDVVFTVRSSSVAVEPSYSDYKPRRTTSLDCSTRITAVTRLPAR
jgi:Cryptococcal mannosyltransferase 1